MGQALTKLIIEPVSTILVVPDVYMVDLTFEHALDKSYLAPPLSLAQSRRQQLYFIQW